jgi:hypothetical protein
LFPRVRALKTILPKLDPSAEMAGRHLVPGAAGRQAGPRRCGEEGAPREKNIGDEKFRSSTRQPKQYRKSDVATVLHLEQQRC